MNSNTHHIHPLDTAMFVCDIAVEDWNSGLNFLKVINKSFRKNKRKFSTTYLNQFKTNRKYLKRRFMQRNILLSYFQINVCPPNILFTTYYDVLPLQWGVFILLQQPPPYIYHHN